MKTVKSVLPNTGEKIKGKICVHYTGIDNSTGKLVNSYLMDAYTEKEHTCESLEVAFFKDGKYKNYNSCRITKIQTRNWMAGEIRL